MNKKQLLKWNTIIHRDFGYFLSGLIIMYSISGIALNHIDDWNPDFIITKEKIKLKRSYTKSEIREDLVKAFSQMVDEDVYKIYDFPTEDQLKIYYNKSTLHLNLKEATGLYEKLSRRHVFYETNLLHRNSIKGWKWASDVLGAMLIIISLTGLFILQGSRGLSGRGKWLLMAGFLPPLIAFAVHYAS